MNKLFEKIISLILVILLLPAGHVFAEESLENTPEDIPPVEIVVIDLEESSPEDADILEEDYDEPIIIEPEDSATEDVEILDEDNDEPIIIPDEIKQLSEIPPEDSVVPTYENPSSLEHSTVDTGSGEASTKEVQDTPKTLPDNIYLSDISVGTSPANEKYSYLSFFFSDEKDSKQYECYITGLEIDPSSAFDTNTFSSYQKLCEDIAKSFYLDQKFDISDRDSFKEAYNLSVRPIDAEKQNSYYDPDPLNPEVGKDDDSAFCWACTTSNMFVYSGWADAGNAIDPENTKAPEDQMFDYFTENFYNGGSHIEVGLRYLFSGEYSLQSSGANNAIIFEPSTSSAQIRSQDAADSSKAYLKDYCVDTVMAGNSIGYEVSSDFDKLTDDVSQLKTGSVLSLSHEGHVETLLGYIIDTLSSGFNALKAVFLADSDNDAYYLENPPETYPIDRSDLPNSLTMYTNPTIPSDNVARNVSDTNTEDTPSAAIIISDWVVLKPYSSSVAKEDSSVNSLNPKTDVDIVVEYISSGEDRTYVNSDANIGDDIYLNINFNNSSYMPIDISKNPYLSGTIFVKLNGEDYDSIPVKYSIHDFECYPNRSIGVNGIKYSLSSYGNYSFSFTLDGLFNENGDKVKEAYSQNNVSKIPCTVSVSGKPDPTPAPEVKPPVSTSTFIVKEYNIGISRSDNETVSVSFFSSFTGFGNLVLNNNVVNNSLYSIVKLPDGSFVLSLADELISTLPIGCSTFYLFDSDSTNCIAFNISVSD